MEEKRTSPRFSINQLIGYFPNREEYLWAEGIDISRQGVSCASKTAVEPLTNVYVMLTVPTPEGERSVRCEGYVAHSRMEGDRCIFGIHLDNLSEGDRECLNAYLDRLEVGEIESDAEPKRSDTGE